MMQAEDSDLSVWQSLASIRKSLGRLQWLPVMDRSVVEQFGLNGRPIPFLLGVSGLFAVCTLPPITRFTRVDARWIILLWLGLASWVMMIHHCCYRRAFKMRVAFNVLVFGNIGAGMAITLILVLLSRTPDTPLWLGYCVMACVDGATETEPSILLGALHLIAPFATVPFFLANGTNRVWAIVGPLVCALVSGYGYQLLARRGQRWRQERHERELHQAELRFEKSERERRRLVRDLHDSVATELSFVALLVQLEAEDSVRAGERAASILDAARAGLHGLRGVLQAIPQASIQLHVLADSLMMAAGRIADCFAAKVTVTVRRERIVILRGEVRTAVVRIFQEVIHNALRHGDAKHIDAVFDTDDDTVYLEVVDDGTGFDPGAGGGGTGITGMQERARELGGSLHVMSRVGQGATVQLRLPLRGLEGPR